ncbi:MAG: hypothetical protein JXK05_08730 [Campylobacterales bacterium]|nr:hypothetical protein [Campylobacterales bacterium]
MKILCFLLPLTLAAQQAPQYLFAFDPDRHSACEQAKAQLKALEYVTDQSGCACEKVDFDGWRCVIRYETNASKP